LERKHPSKSHLRSQGASEPSLHLPGYSQTNCIEGILVIFGFRASHESVTLAFALDAEKYQFLTVMSLLKVDWREAITYLR
jgi:hypothetical protein